MGNESRHNVGRIEGNLTSDDCVQAAVDDVWTLVVCSRQADAQATDVADDARVPESEEALAAAVVYKQDLDCDIPIFELTGHWALIAVVLAVVCKNMEVVVN